MDAVVRPSRQQAEKGCAYWAAGGIGPAKVKRTYQPRRPGCHQEFLSSTPFGTEVDHASDTAGSGERLKLLVDGGARCVEVRAKSSAGSSMQRSLTQRNVLTGEGDIETHAASAHMTATLTRGMGFAEHSLTKASPGEGASKHLHTRRNVITGDGVCERTDLHMASAHLAGVGSGTDQATHGSLRRAIPRTPAEITVTPGDSTSPTRNVLLGHGVITHHQSAHLRASASGSARVYRETPKMRRDTMRSSAGDILHHNEYALSTSRATVRTETAAPTKAVPSSSTRSRPSSSHMFGGERPF